MDCFTLGELRDAVAKLIEKHGESTEVGTLMPTSIGELVNYLTLKEIVVIDKRHSTCYVRDGVDKQEGEEVAIEVT
jgi:hypothetical protein